VPLGPSVPVGWPHLPAAEHPALEERVAALEAALAPQPAEWTDEQIAEFQREWDKVKDGPARFLPPPPLLGPDEVRALLRECVTVVKPGETLVVRAYPNTSPAQLRELQQAADVMCEARGLPFRVLVVYGEELTVVEPEPRWT
jgi:hypothetical protein